MKLNSPQRPEWLDFVAYRLVEVEQQGLPQAARSLKLEDERVAEMLHRVNRYMLARVSGLVPGVPGADDEEQRRKQLYLSEQLAAERINHLQKLAMRGFSESRRVKHKLSKKALVDGKQEFDEEVIPGHPRYLLACARLAEMAAKLPLPMLQTVAVEGLIEEAAAEEAQNEQSPPEGSCSAADESAAMFEAMDTLAAAATIDPSTVCIDGVDPALIAKLAREGTVQRPASAGDSERPTKPDRRSKQGRRDAFLRGE